MILNDFCYMHAGKRRGPLQPSDQDLLLPIDNRTNKQNRALLLLHGFTSSPAVYRALMPQLTQYDACIVPVLPGHGESIRALSTSRATDWLSTAHDACEALCRAYESVDVLGLSLGGVLAYRLSQQFRLNHLYLLAPAFALHHHIPLMLKLLRILKQLGIRTIYNRGGNIHGRMYDELTYKRIPLSAIIEVLSLIQSTQLTKPSCPVDIFLGALDAVVDSSAVARLASDWPLTKIHWLPRSAHILPLDEDYDVIGKFLNGQT